MAYLRGNRGWFLPVFGVRLFLEHRGSSLVDSQSECSQLPKFVVWDLKIKNKSAFKLDTALFIKSPLHVL